MTSLLCNYYHVLLFTFLFSVLSKCSESHRLRNLKTCTSNMQSFSAVKIENFIKKITLFKFLLKTLIVGKGGDDPQSMFWLKNTFLNPGL